MPAQPIQTQGLEFDDFSGGMTDYYIGAPLNKFQRGDNVLLVKHGAKAKLFTRPGSALYDDAHYQIPAGAQRISSLKYFQSQLFFQSARKMYYISGSGWTTLQGPTSNDVFPAGIDTTAVYSYATWNKHLLVANDQYSKPQKIYQDGSLTWQVRTAGMPVMTVDPTVTAGGGTGHSYIYRFLRSYTYTVGTLTYIDRGAAVEVALADSDPPNSTAVGITNIQALTGAAGDNYDTASADFKIEIYRTTDGGQFFFKAGSVANGVTSFSDTMSDSDLQDQEPLYTDDGAPDNDPPPLCKTVHIVDDRAYYGNLKIDGQIFANRIVQSIPGDIDSVPGSFFTEVQDTVVAISSVRSLPVALCDDMVFRLDGFFDELGGGGIVPQKISDTSGCVSSASVVQTIIGVFWAGKDGFYYTDGYTVSRVSDGIDKTYATFTETAEQKRRITGKFDAKRKVIYWTMQSAAGSDCDTVFALDLNFGLSDDMPFTTLSGSDNFAPTGVEVIDGNLIRADRRGYTFQHSDTLYTDPKVDVALTPDLWNVATIIYDYICAATNFGTIQARKWVPRITVNCKNETNLSLQVISINDDGRRRGNLSPIRFRGNVTWGDPDVYWGDPDILWNYSGLIDDYLRFPAQNLRCEYKQVEFTNAFVAIISSDLLGTATVNTSAHTATLTDTVTYDWPTGSVDYYLAFASDGYTNEYLVTGRTADVLTFTDAGGTAPNGVDQTWVLRGKPKGEVMHLLDFTLHYAVFGMTQLGFRNTGTGEVGAADE